MKILENNAHGSKDDSPYLKKWRNELIADYDESLKKLGEYTLKNTTQEMGSHSIRDTITVDQDMIFLIENMLVIREKVKTVMGKITGYRNNNISFNKIIKNENIEV